MVMRVRTNYHCSSLRDGSRSRAQHSRYLNQSQGHGCCAQFVRQKIGRMHRAADHSGAYDADRDVEEMMTMSGLG